MSNDRRAVILRLLQRFTSVTQSPWVSGPVRLLLMGKCRHSLGTVLVPSSDMIDRKGLFCSHGDRFSLETKVNVDIVTKVDGSRMVLRGQVEGVRG